MSCCKSHDHHLDDQQQLLRIRRVLLSVTAVYSIFLLGATPTAAATPTSYANVTLTSSDGDLSIVVYLPAGIKPPDEPVYYYASRFEHGSMIGSITRRIRSSSSSGGSGGGDRTHVLYGTDMWRIPHNQNWPESGVGLASEFGVGDDGAFCNFHCGWSATNHVTNGLLGYQEARNGEPFLKIGVGELVKGTCPQCDSTDDFKFNSPYMFSRRPSWTMTMGSEPNSLRLENRAMLRNHGYLLVKEIALVDNNVLTVTSTLTNLGVDSFSTAWYSHHFFTCDGNAVGPGYSVDLQVKGTDRDGQNLYEEPGTWTWATPLTDYAKVKRHPDFVHVEMDKALEPGVRIKTEFSDDKETSGAFTMRACESKIESSFPQLEEHTEDSDSDHTIAMYGYNLYIERGTFSPEPQILIRLNPGQSATWTQRIVVDGDDQSSAHAHHEAKEDEPVEFPMMGAPAVAASISSTTTNSSVGGITPALHRFFGCMGLFFVAVVVQRLMRKRSHDRRRRSHYQSIPETTNSSNVDEEQQHC